MSTENALIAIQKMKNKAKFTRFLEYRNKNRHSELKIRQMREQIITRKY